MKPTVALLAALLLAPLAALQAGDFTPAARKFLDQRCAECHDADVQKGNGIKPFLVQRGSFQGVAKCYD